MAQVHLTLLFLGRSAIRDLSQIEESIERSASGIPPFELVPDRLIALPERGPARVIAAQTPAPAALLELRRRLVRRLASASRREPNDRFVPHLTLARITPPSRVTLAPPNEDQAAGLSSGAFPVTSIHLMESRLHPSGAEHNSVAEVRLVP